jgi:hypothetical protein
MPTVDLFLRWEVEAVVAKVPSAFFGRRRGHHFFAEFFVA